MKEDLLKAIDLALGGEWEASHQLVQQFDDDATAAWIHAVLHKMEGDLANSRYWYRRAGRWSESMTNRAVNWPSSTCASLTGERGAMLARTRNS